jgi:hypothetical protein
MLTCKIIRLYKSTRDFDNIANDLDHVVPSVVVFLL